MKVWGLEERKSADVTAPSLQGERKSRREEAGEARGSPFSLVSAALTPTNDHFCDYATGPRLLAANHKNDTGRCGTFRSPAASIRQRGGRRMKDREGGEQGKKHEPGSPTAEARKGQEQSKHILERGMFLGLEGHSERTHIRRKRK